MQYAFDEKGEVMRRPKVSFIRGMFYGDVSNAVLATIEMYFISLVSKAYIYTEELVVDFY